MVNAAQTQCAGRMKSAVIPQIRVEPELRAELESVLRQGETLTDVVGAGVRNDIAFRQLQTAFSIRKAAQNPAQREMIVPFGGTGYGALLEIVSVSQVVVPAVRHQRKEDCH